MFRRTKYRASFVPLLLVLVLAVATNIGLGSISIPIGTWVDIIFNRPLENESWGYIIWNYRFPKAIAAILVGSGLALSGLLMQTFFRNPLAGPFVLGISSGASLGAALLLMESSVVAGTLGIAILNDVSLVIAASVGSFLVLLVVLIVANRVKDTLALLIIGLMFGSITTALVSVLTHFSNAEQLRKFIFWSFGSVGNLTWSQIGILGTIIFIGTGLGIYSIKTLNVLLLGENYAVGLGLDIKRTRIVLIVATGLLAGSITAFAGPIAFVGLAVPHLARQIFNTPEHRILIPAVTIYGAILMLVCDTIAQLPGSVNVLPINAITSMVGAPVVIWLLLQKRKMVF